MELYELERLAQEIAIARKLLGKADGRHLTHGEKHHFNHVIGKLLDEIQAEICSAINLEKHQNGDRPDEIPF